MVPPVSSLETCVDAGQRPPGPGSDRPGTSWPALAGTGLVALAVGLAAGTLLGGGGLVGEDDDLQTACRYVEDFGSGVAERIALDEPLVWQVGGAAQIAVAAGLENGDEALREAGTDLMTAMQQLDGELVDAAIDKIGSHCD